MGDAPARGSAPGAVGTVLQRRGSRELIEVGRRFGLVALLAVIIVVFSFVSPQFMTASNWSGLLVTQAVGSCVTFAALWPLIVGEFDLSLGYALGFVTMIGAWVAGHGEGTPVVLGVMIGAGLLIGLVNGVLTVGFGISSFIATLGVGFLLSGLTLGLSGGEVLFNGIPNFILASGRDQFLGLQYSVWFAFAIAVILLYLFEYTPLGRYMYAIGGSERVSFLAGVRTRRLKIIAFMAAGFLIAVGAIFELGSGAGANPSTGPTFLLPAYAAAFLGVTTYRAGRYNIVGTVFAILVLAVGFDGLSLIGVPAWGEPVFDGAVLLVAVLLARAEARQVQVG